ncbi:hypothetical protein Rfer_4363 (plasmid) [Rhodoferax ferrireducens T118]|uniref:DeoxyPurine in DNA protein A domain-containing protein n=2 Tax=Rhodoferax ferrireducens TaxID=192843 RepID=Q21Q96_ALBFT|nr:hypothetical protein Rfer_4363 [Rhodoferax ferrireducens T118]
MGVWGIRRKTFTSVSKEELEFQSPTRAQTPNGVRACHQKATMNCKNIVVRAGVPQPSGALVQAAYAAGLPVLFSANAFAKSNQGEFFGFNLKAAQNIPADLDAALDSAGYVAAVRYGDYRWTTEQYYSLVASRKWAWHAAMDYCVEPPVASSLVVRLMRLEATATGYLRCCNEARKRGLPLPMPVLQGWYPEDYRRCADMLAIQDWPAMVGIGSVCRRNVGGIDGIESVIEALDRVLPSHVQFHLFGVKSGAMREMGGHHRFVSIDSMAWDFAMRMEHRTGRTQSMRAAAMINWQAKQVDIEPKDWVHRVLREHIDHDVKPRRKPVEQVVHETVANWYAENLLADHGYRESNRMAREQAEMLCMQLKTFGRDYIADSTDAVDMAVLQALSEHHAA